MTLRLILSFSLIALATGAAPVAPQLAAAAGEARAQPAESPQIALRRVIALLDYVAGDYLQAVGEDGAVRSATELSEQRGFLAEAARELRADAGPQGEDLARGLDQLGERVARHEPPAQVSPRARAIRDEVAQRFRVTLLPTRAPDFAHGAALYAQACAACHGADGHAPPKEKLQQPTQPPSFAVADEVKELSVQRAFHAITYGVPSTSMPAYDQAYDDAARWDLAFYLLSMAHPGPADAARGAALARAALVPVAARELAALSDTELLARLTRAGLSADDAQVALAALRQGPLPLESAESTAELSQVRRALHQAVAMAKAGDREGARRALVSAYLDQFEPHEPAMRARDSDGVTRIERQFLALRAAVEAGSDPGPPLAELDESLARAASSGTGGAAIAFAGALAIALREGVEAALIVAALLALLRKAGKDREARVVHCGWASALAVGAVLWFVSGALLGVGGTSRELVEALVQLLTAVVLLWASHWLLAQSSARKLIGMLAARASSAQSAGVVFSLAFFAVIREMLEVVLFYRGLLLEAPSHGTAIAGGAVVGVLALAALVAAFQKFGRRLRPRPLLLTCGGLLCGLSAVMVGNGIRSLQLMGAVPLTVWTRHELPALGLFGTREGLLSQLAVLAVVVGLAVVSALRAPPASAIKTG